MYGNNGECLYLRMVVDFNGKADLLQRVRSPLWSTAVRLRTSNSNSDSGRQQPVGRTRGQRILLNAAVQQTRLQYYVFLGPQQRARVRCAYLHFQLQRRVRMARSTIGQPPATLPWQSRRIADSNARWSSFRHSRCSGPFVVRWAQRPAVLLGSRSPRVSSYRSRSTPIPSDSGRRRRLAVGIRTGEICRTTS